MIQINRSAEKENDQVSALAQKSPELILREMHKWGLRNAVHREIKKCNAFAGIFSSSLSGAKTKLSCKYANDKFFFFPVTWLGM